MTQAIAAIREGLRARQAYAISTGFYADGLAAYYEVNPMHTDDAVTRRHDFPEKVTPGTVPNGSNSRFFWRVVQVGLI